MTSCYDRNIIIVIIIMVISVISLAVMYCSFVAVELMRSGVEPAAAAATAIKRISRVYPSSSAALIALNMTGDYGKPIMYFPFLTIL